MPADKAGYQVLARKWRPQRFEQVVGQQPIVQTLANALRQGRVAHAYCFSGIRGVGKTTLARLLAKGLNCRASETPTPEPCGTCESCTEIMAGNSMDVFERDAASDRRIDDMRELIEIARYAPSRDRYKVMILDEAHMLTQESSNALLKLLEEPPSYIVFVLATTEPNKILPTILSRCQHYQFRRVSQRDIAAHLRKIADAESVQIAADALALVAAAADGSLRDAQSLLDKLIAFGGDQIEHQTVVELLGLIDRMLLFRATELVAAGDLPGVLGFVNEMVDSGVDLHQFAVDLLGHVRNLLVVHTVPDPAEILHLPEADIEQLRQQAELFGVEDLDRAFALIAAHEYRIKQAEQPRYHLELVLARLARMPHLEPIEKLVAALSGDAGPSEGQPASGGGAPGTRPEPPEPVTPPAPAQSPAPEQSLAAADPPAAAASPERAPAPATDSCTDSTLLRRIQEHVHAANPLIAPVLERTCGISLAGETIVFKFPASAEIFADRVRDPAVLALLSAGAAEVLGRAVVARVETDASAGAAPPTAAREAPEPTSTPAPPQPRGDVSPSAPPDAGTAAPSPGAATLRQRVEGDAQVQEFVRALKGQITSVEEPSSK